MFTDVVTGRMPDCFRGNAPTRLEFLGIATKYPNITCGVSIAGTTEGVNMAEEQAPPAGPDLAQGIAPSDFTGETLLGHVGDQDVLLVRSGAEIFAIEAHCSHYHGPLAEGLVVGDSIRCPCHPPWFDFPTGAPSPPPPVPPPPPSQAPPQP